MKKIKYSESVTVAHPKLTGNEHFLKKIDDILKKDYSNIPTYFNEELGIDGDKMITGSSVDLCIGLDNNEYLLVEFKLDVKRNIRRNTSRINNKFENSKSFLNKTCTINKSLIIVWNEEAKDSIRNIQREITLAKEPYIPHTLQSFYKEYF